MKLLVAQLSVKLLVSEAVSGTAVSEVALSVKLLVTLLSVKLLVCEAVSDTAVSEAACQ